MGGCARQLGIPRDPSLLYARRLRRALCPTARVCADSFRSLQLSLAVVDAHTFGTADARWFRATITHARAEGDAALEAIIALPHTYPNDRPVITLLPLEGMPACAFVAFAIVARRGRCAVCVARPRRVSCRSCCKDALYLARFAQYVVFSARRPMHCSFDCCSFGNRRDDHGAGRPCSTCIGGASQCGKARGEGTQGALCSDGAAHADVCRCARRRAQCA